ncbi:pentatricopeptide repeat-containing protein At4g16470-like isoform X1 [Chenopodium quinoa]|uniref:pentatricopeptide repeat-containing protein At4g16470-like isoform X1 n=1 Tax=Chenopodium quinoa TaxID=63459 RepID=UPI000B78C415|nr:pentatricopeptide repeat-containing protein At4g16470-like isoform X1 [Chenopodium quinoa]
MLNTLPKMKSLISPKTFSLLPKSSPSFQFCFQRPFFLHKTPNFLSPLPPFSPMLRTLRSYASSSSHQAQQHPSSSPPPSSCGEIHVIVGPMFAGKTTSLLRRIQSECSNGSFQAAQVKSSSLVLDKTLKDLCYSGRLMEAVGLLCRSEAIVDWHTYSLLLQECIHGGTYEWGKIIHAHMVIVGFTLNEYLKTKLLILYSKAGKLGTACILFDELLEKSLISWNAMIAGYVQKSMEDVGLSLYHKMRHIGVTPDQFTFSSVFRACASLAILEQGRQAHGVMVKCGIGKNVVANSALMDMYFKCSCLIDGHQVFVKSSDKNVITWTALISGYGHNGRTGEVLDLFDKMIKEGLRPNYVTFLAVLSACSHRGLVDEGWKYFLLMKNDYEIQPHRKHYAAMVDLLGRAGRLEEAYNFINSSPCKENSVVWGSLLGACRLHGNVKLLKLSAMKFFELEPENAGKYVVLSHTFASHAMWENVAEVWGLMRDFGVKKDPGYSRIELQNEVHYFYKSDNTHKDTKDIYEMLKVLTCALVDSDYIPDLSFE